MEYYNVIKYGLVFDIVYMFVNEKYIVCLILAMILFIWIHFKEVVKWIKN